MGLTDLFVRKLPLKPHRYEVHDQNGLYIRVTPHGSKSWTFRYSFEGKPQRLTLGRYPAMSLSQARVAQHRAMTMLAQGIDPGRAKMQEKAARIAAPTIADLINEFWEKELARKRSGRETLRLLKKDVLPAWGDRKVSDIKRRDIVILIDQIRDRAFVTSNRVLGALSRLFNFAAERGIIDDSPCTRIRRASEQPRRRVLTDDEIRMLWSALEINNKTIGVYLLSRLAIKMILVSGQRPGEVAGMAWDEVEDGFWRTPAERMKGGEEHKVPITPLMRDVLDQASRLSRDSKYVFKSPRLEDVPINAQSLSHAIKRHHHEIFPPGTEKITPHDLRRTVRTRLAALGVEDVVAERLLGHKLQGILAVYNRYSYDSEKYQALMRWENELRRIVRAPDADRANVVWLPKRGSSDAR